MRSEVINAEYLPMPKIFCDLRFNCECGLKFVSKDSEAYYVHISDKTHVTRMEKMLRGIRYSQKQLRDIAKINKIPYYKNLSMPDMVKQLDALGKKLKLE